MKIDSIPWACAGFVAVVSILSAMAVISFDGGDLNVLFSLPFLAVFAILLFFGWMAGESLAEPWREASKIASKIGGEKRKFREIGLVLHQLGKGEEGIMDLRNEISQLRVALAHRKKTQLIKGEKGRRAILNILEDVEEANKKLKELDRLKMDFLNITSHELKNPLTPIIAYDQMLLDGTLGKTSKEQKKALEVIARNSDKLKRLVSDVLDISKLEGKRMKYLMEKCDGAKLVQEAVQDQKIMAEEANVRLELKVIGKIPRIKVDKNRIIQAITNYITNAIKFSPKGGRVQVRAKADRKFMVVEVQDWGVGISREDSKRLFQKFSQVSSTISKNRSGTGLGLAICKWIIEDHGGKVGVRSKLGEGSTFYLKIPLRFSPRTANIVKKPEELSTLDDIKEKKEEGKENKRGKKSI